jgi:hypothetical protein
MCRSRVQHDCEVREALDLNVPFSFLLFFVEISFCFHVYNLSLAHSLTLSHTSTKCIHENVVISLLTFTDSRFETRYLFWYTLRNFDCTYNFCWLIVYVVSSIVQVRYHPRFSPLARAMQGSCVMCVFSQYVNACVCLRLRLRLRL